MSAPVVVVEQIGISPWLLGSLPLGVGLDLALGDPRSWPHPVRAIGGLIQAMDRGFRKAMARPGGASRETLNGVILAVMVISITAFVAWVLTSLFDRLGGPIQMVGRGVLIYWGLAIRSLADETLRASEAPDLATARVELAKVVGRDTANLEEREVARACVETVGENTSDAIVAPLFWLALGGPVGLWAFKAISTLDSMVGYKNAVYLRFGWASARIDDLACLIPARLSWLLIALASAMVGERGAEAFRIGWRDGRKHPSPNAAWGEAAIAGALGVQLGGQATYGGHVSFKPLLGDPGTPVGRETVQRAVRIMQVVALIAASLAWMVQVGLMESGLPRR